KSPNIYIVFAHFFVIQNVYVPSLLFMGEYSKKFNFSGIYNNESGKSYLSRIISVFAGSSNQKLSTLKVEDVNEHIQRLEKLQNNPPKYIKDTILLGAVAGMRIEQNADKYAYRKGFYVLKQKGEIMEIANNDKFKPKEWKIE
ncbi:unnamed protein product, partial [marine sediment metagenome]